MVPANSRWDTLRTLAKELHGSLAVDRDGRVEFGDVAVPSLAGSIWWAFPSRADPWCLVRDRAGLLKVWKNGLRRSPRRALVQIMRVAGSVGAARTGHGPGDVLRVSSTGGSVTHVGSTMTEKFAVGQDGRVMLAHEFMGYTSLSGGPDARWATHAGTNSMVVRTFEPWSGPLTLPISERHAGAETLRVRDSAWWAETVKAGVDGSLLPPGARDACLAFGAIHGDATPENVCKDSSGLPVWVDWSFWHPKAPILSDAYAITYDRHRNRSTTDAKRFATQWRVDLRMARTLWEFHKMAILRQCELRSQCLPAGPILDPAFIRLGGAIDDGKRNQD